MVFTETIFPTGKILFKGLENLSCDIMLHDSRFFYLTESRKRAHDYGNTCAFRVKKSMRLFDLSHANISKLLASGYPLQEDTRGLLRTVTGTGVTVGAQALAAKLLIGSPEAGTLPLVNNMRPGQRLSYKELDRMVFGKLSREFLVPEGYDGYYSPKKPSVFHGGTFHSEIMLCNAYQSIERTRGAAPLATSRTFKWALPRIFIDFCKGSSRLTRPYGGDLTIFCTGGMGVRLFLAAQKAQLAKKIRRTSDFDFTFAVPRKLPSEAAVSSYVFIMRKIMTDHLMAFVRFLNREYKGVNASLKVNNWTRSRHDAPREQVPGTGRKVYQVITYQIVTGNGELIDFVDTALAVYPKASRAMLHLPFSNKIGIPIQKIDYQLTDTLALLSGSFLYGGLIAKRNPLTGDTKEKGQKNVARARELIRVNPRASTLARKALPLLNDVARRNFLAAKRHARSVNRIIKRGRPA